MCRRRTPMATIPPGVISISAGGQRTQRYFHDFFNYAGLHRSVWLYATPGTSIDGITVSTGLDAGTGEVRYHVDVVDGPRSRRWCCGTRPGSRSPAPPVPTAPCACPRPGPGSPVTRTAAAWLLRQWWAGAG
jgi:hypothetical protein